jgi:REP element-mobilizing transposase RayT
MSRPLRIEFPGALYHVTSRGNRREQIYSDETDRVAFLEVLANVCERFRWACYAYCLMSNHYHIMVETRDANLARGMRHLNGVYTQRFNRRHGRVGHVYQGRYHAVLVKRESHLLAVARYIVLNPVRAGMVRAAGNWRWSSYRATAGRTAPPPWLTTEWLLTSFGPAHDARQEYERFVNSDVDQASPWQDIRQQLYVGDEDFVLEMQSMRDRVRDSVEVPLAQRKLRPLPIIHFERESTDRNAAIVAAFRQGGHTLKEIGEYFGLHYSHVGRIVRAAERTGCVR